MPLFDYFRNLTAASPSGEDERQAKWRRTVAVQERLENAPGYRPPDAAAPYGYYEGRFIIGSGMSRVIGGVYLGAGAREAIVVKERLTDVGGYEHEGLLPQAYRSFMDRRFERSQREGRPFREGILRAVFDEVSGMMRYDADAVEALAKRALAHRSDQKVALDHFVLEGVGVCRQQALLMAYFLEKLCQESSIEYGIRGTFSIERNEITTPTERVGAHVWVRFSSATSGRTYIFDVAQGVCGELKDLIGDPKKWIYARPEELAAFQKKR